MIAFWLFVIAGSLALMNCDDEGPVTISAEVAKEIEAKFDRLAAIENVLKTILGNQEEEREQCLPWDSPCSFYSGPNCCGVRMRCFVFKGRCREYNLGVLIDNVVNGTRRLG